MFKMKKFVSGILACAMIFTASISTFAASSTMSNSTESLMEIANNSVEITDSNKITNTKNIVEKEDLILNHVDARLDFENATLLDTFVEGDSYTSLTVPVVGKNYSVLSNVTYTLKDNKIITYTESLITTGDDGKLIVSNHMDGIPTEIIETGVYISDSEIQEELDRINEIVQNAQSQRGVGAVAGCLAGLLGIDTALATVLVSMCAGSCPAVPPICAACIGAVATVGVGNMAALVACFNLL